MDFPWIFRGFSVDLPWIFRGFAVDFPWIFRGFAVDFPWILRCCLHGQCSGGDSDTLYKTFYIMHEGAAVAHVAQRSHQDSSHSQAASYDNQRRRYQVIGSSQASQVQELLVEFDTLRQQDQSGPKAPIEAETLQKKTKDKHVRIFSSRQQHQFLSTKSSD